MKNSNVYIEKVIIGCILLRGELYEKIMGKLSIEDFTDILYQKIFRIFGKFYENQTAIDSLTIDDYAYKNNISDIGLSILKDIQDAVPSRPVPLDQYIKILKYDTYERTSSKFTEEFRLGKITGEKLREELNNIKPSSEIKKETNKDIILATLEDSEKGTNFKFPSNFEGLNKYTGGFDRGDLIIIGGYPSSGKSSMTTDLACGFCNELGYSVLVITLEMSVQANMRRILANMQKINTMRFRRGILDEEDREKIRTMVPIINDIWEYHCVRCYGMQDIIRAEVEYQPDIVIIDYLQNIADKENLSEYARLTKFTLQLQQIARKKGIATILLSQFHRPELGKIRRPRNSDFRGSGSIEERAEMIFLLYWERKLKMESLSRGDEEDPEYMIVDITKNKDGETGRVKMEYYPEYHKWVAWDNEYSDKRVIKYKSARDVAFDKKHDT